MLNIDCICNINCIAKLQKLTFTNLQFSKHNFKFNVYKLTMISSCENVQFNEKIQIDFVNLFYTFMI